MKLFCFSSSSGQSFRVHAESEGEASKEILKGLGIRMMGALVVVDTVRVPLTNHYIPASSFMGKAVRLGFGNL